MTASEHNDDLQSPAHAGLSYNDEPIAALASGGGRAAVALIRLSGRGCHELARQILVPVGSREFTARELRLTRLIDPRSGECLDEPMAVFFMGPRSFTGEDTVELNCHGGPFIVQRVFELLFRIGFRAAEPGEFTRRAFLNGKLDLTQAEGVRELVEAQSHQQWLAARQLATGQLGSAIDGLRSSLIEAMAYLEARIDFPDEGDTQSAELDFVRRRVADVRREVTRLVATYDNGRVASQGLAVALLGAPNVGKSTLMNTLLGRERAIVTEIAGTTRDYLEEPCLVRGRLIRLIDTAGVRETTEVVEKIGVESSLRIAREADLVLALASSQCSDAERAALETLLATLPADRVIRVVTKGDLARPGWARDWVTISCHGQAGLKELEECIVQRVDGYVGGLKEETFVTSARHLRALEEALAAVDRFVESDAEGAFEECLAFELQQAARALAAIIGAVDSDDVLDKIFREFCVGK